MKIQGGLMALTVAFTLELRLFPKFWIIFDQAVLVEGVVRMSPFTQWMLPYRLWGNAVRLMTLMKEGDPSQGALMLRKIPTKRSLTCFLPFDFGS